MNNTEYTCPMGNNVCHCYYTTEFIHKKEIIETIYLKIANKTFDRGCKFKYKSMYGNNILTIIDYTNNGILIYENEVGEEYEEVINERDIDKFQIIGHSIMIGDVLDYNGIINLIGEGRNEIVNILICAWENKRLPIEKQSDECILYVYNLIK